MKQRPWGKESRDYLRTITPKTVRILPKTKDRYGRTVAEVWTHDGDEIQENLNLAMVWAGRAAVYKNYCSDKEYYLAQDNAESAGSGIWKKAGDWQNPWTIRRK
jgi:endonuclease YncB( thermonuclease family)